MANASAAGPDPLFSGDLDAPVSWEQVNALAELYGIRLEFTADDWGVPSGDRYDAWLAEHPEGH